jgi:hypothetical protein
MKILVAEYRVANWKVEGQTQRQREGTMRTEKKIMA